jgi:hypothetical protein
LIRNHPLEQFSNVHYLQSMINIINHILSDPNIKSSILLLNNKKINLNLHLNRI